MSWNIFKKDVRLLWLFIAINIVVQLLFTLYAVQLAGRVDSFDFSGIFLRRLALYLVRDMGMALPILLAIQQDGPSSIRQDWLTRPIAHKDLFLAKLLFVLFAAQGPIVIANLVASLTMANPMLVGNLMPAEPSAGPLTVIGVFYEVLSTFITVSLPVMIVASLTRNLRGAILVISLLLVGLSSSDLIPTLLHYFNLSVSLGGRDYNDWLVAIAKSITVLCAAVIILFLQYFRRRTRLAVAFGILFFLVYVGLPFFPWPSEFAVQATLLPQPASAAPISISYDADHGKFRDAGGSKDWLYIPLRVRGLGKNFILTASDAEFRLLDANGKVIYQKSVSTPYFFREDDAWIDGSGDTENDIRTYDSFSVPTEIYTKYKDKMISVEVDYSLIQLREAGRGTIATENGRGEIAGLGTCTTGLSPIQSMRCSDPMANSHCVGISAENAATGERNPREQWCLPDLTPRALHWFGPAESDSINFASAFRYPQAADAAEFPVKLSQASQSRLIVTTYVPMAFIEREIKSPPMHLSDLKGTGGNKMDYQQSLAEDAAFKAGNDAFQRKDWDKVITDFSAAIELDPTDADAFHNRAEAYLSKSDYDKAIADYDEAIRLDPTDSDSFTNRGNAYFDKSDYDKAVADYSQAIRLNPKDADALNDRCYTKALQNLALELDLADCNASLKLAPNSSDALGSLGLVYFRMGDYARSIADYDAALRNEPKNAEALYQRGISKIRAQNPIGGRADIAAALAMDPKAGDDLTKAGIKP